MTTQEYIRYKAMLAVVTELIREYGKDMTLREVADDLKQSINFENLS